MAKSSKTRASKRPYVSPGQGVLPCFEIPFSGSLSPTNRWVVLVGKIPCDVLVKIYLKQMRNGCTGASGINPRVVLGALIIKQICDLSDRETIEQIRENVYMQYFIGYSVVIRYMKTGELLNEETAKERSENKVCSFTTCRRQMVKY